MSTMRLRRWLLALCGGTALAQASVVNPTTVEAVPAAQWAQRLRSKERDDAIRQLADGKERSFAALRELLVHADDQVGWAAAKACERMGPAAAPLKPDLLRGLCSASGWWTQFECGHALAAIGVPDRDVLAALLQHVTRSKNAKLRAECAAAFARLHPDPGKELLAMFARGELASKNEARDALLAAGDRGTDALVAALREPPVAALAEDVLRRRGWRVVPALERAGHTVLAEQVQLAAPLRALQLGDAFVVERTKPPASIDRLPAIEWARAKDKTGGIVLFRAEDDARGLHVVRTALMERPGGADAAATVADAIVPRDLAMAAVRQVLVLPCLSVRPAVPGARAAAKPTANATDLLAAVRIHGDGGALVDTAFAGAASSDTVPQRLVAEAGAAILTEALDGAEWQTREPTREDRELVASFGAHLPTAAAPWVAPRLQRLHELLVPPPAEPAVEPPADPAPVGPVLGEGGNGPVLRYPPP